MQIDHFKALIQQGASGRISQSNDHNAQPSSASQRLGGKVVGVVKDFFARVSKEVRQEQSMQNWQARVKLGDALEDAYRGRVPDAILDKALNGLEKDLGKPLSVKDAKKLIDKFEVASDRAMTVTLPGSDKTVHLSPSTFPRAMLSEVPNLKQEIQTKIDRGHQLVSDILSGNRGPIPQATLQEVTDIAWFLHISAEGKAGAQFKSGSLTTLDAQQGLRTFLDSCPESYQRHSSHVNEFQKVDGGTHRGIDIPKGNGVDSLLPHGRTTILYGTLAKNTDDPEKPPMAENLLFFKLESHGCRLASPSRKDRDDGHQDRRVRLGHDIKNFLGHTFSFISGIKARITGEHGADTRKERIPADVKKDFKELVKNAPPGLRGVLMQNDPMGKSGGIRVMMYNILEAKERQELNRQGGVDGHRDAHRYDPNLHNGINFEERVQFVEDIFERYGRDESLDLRIGNEVILLPQDLALV